MEQQQLKVTLLQMDTAWNNPIQNIRTAETFLEQSPGSDLYVLPEMWTTGFNSSPTIMDDPGISWMTKTAQQLHTAIVGSLAIHEKGKWRNRLLFALPNSAPAIYDKHHLFAYGGEKEHFTPGDRRTIVKWKGVRFLPLICYDLRFPIWSRYRGDYDILVYVANWPVTRIEAWTTLLRARAIENQCYVIGVNRTGQDLSCSYEGASAVVDPYGKTTTFPSPSPGWLTVTLDLKNQNSFRKKFPILDDRD